MILKLQVRDTQIDSILRPKGIAAVLLILEVNPKQQ